MHSRFLYIIFNFFVSMKKFDWNICQKRALNELKLDNSVVKKVYLISGKSFEVFLLGIIFKKFHITSEYECL